MRPALLLLAIALGSCTAPEIVEDTYVSCKNSSDDDGDGMTDCEDPSCDGSGACETTVVACHNGRDDDGDLLVDCQEDSCVAAGACAQAVTACDLLTQEGCTAGMGCYKRGTISGGFEIYCRLAGEGREGGVCSAPELGALGPDDPHQCAEGYGCSLASTDNGTCGELCESNADCSTYGSMCAPNGLCTSPCDPRTVGSGGCRAPYACVSRHELGVAITDGAHTFTCVDGALKRGTAVNDQACVDSPTAATPASEICRSDHVCLSTTTPGSFICRPMCTIGGTLCDGGRSCARLSAKGAPVGVDNLTFGACVGP